jgi:acetylornithine deacetylase
MLTDLRRDDPEFDGWGKVMFSRPPYEVPPSHDLPPALISAAASAGITASAQGMTFWTDAAVLGGAGIPSILFGPGGAGLHSVEEYVNVNEVIACRNALASLALEWP